jgi:23S rRNA (guanosine2251-2'-O)-methyltransferase
MATSGKHLLYGRKPILEALQANKPIDRILMFHSITGEVVGDILALAKEKHIPIVRVPNEKLNFTTHNANHQGMVAYGAVVDYLSLQDVISHSFEQGRTPFLLLLDGVTDVRNAGAIIRSAVCCGVEAIIFTEKNSAPIHEDMIKTSAGAMMKIDFCREKSLQVVVDILKLNGIEIISSDLRATQSLMDINFTTPCCIVMGGEENGISSTVRQNTDHTFKIPMIGEFDSLNVSVATGIICFEAMKQRMKL